MKKTIIASIMLTSTAVAQSLTATPGNTVTQLFQTASNQVVAGMDFDASQNVFYLLQTNSTTQLVRRNAADAYTAATTLFDFGAPVFGSFVRLSGQTLYFGENSLGSVRKYDLANSTSSLLATVIGNYDLDISGGFGWLSANPGAATFATQNEVVKLNLSTGATTTLLTTTDYSGPVALDTAGSLYYGATQYGVGGDIFKYTAAELAVGGLVLDAGHKFRDNVNNADFTLPEGSPALFTTDYSGIFREELGAVPNAQTWATSTHTIGFLANSGGAIFASVTDYGANRSAVFAVVPEPATASLLALAAGLLGFRRRGK